MNPSIPDSVYLMKVTASSAVNPMAFFAATGLRRWTMCSYTCRCLLHGASAGEIFTAVPVSPKLWMRACANLLVSSSRAGVAAKEIRDRSGTSL
jgi:hypothetical protein